MNGNGEIYSTWVRITAFLSLSLRERAGVREFRDRSQYSRRLITGGYLAFALCRFQHRPPAIQRRIDDAGHDRQIQPAAQEFINPLGDGFRLRQGYTVILEQ